MRSQLLLLAVCFIGTTWSVVPLQWNNGNFDIVQYANKIVQFFNSLNQGNLNIEPELDSMVRPDAVNGLRDFMPCKNGDGVCTSANECKRKGGSLIGACQNCVGCAVCCKYELPCHAQTADYISYFSSPGYPAALRKSGSCSASVTVRKEVCQVRLDFLEFEMAAPPAPPAAVGPTVPAMCQCRRGDSLDIQNPRQQAGIFGPGNNRMCGLNSGKHIYLDVNPDSLIVISATTSGTAPVPLAGNLLLGGNAASKWNIKITQIPCGRPEVRAEYSTNFHGHSNQQLSVVRAGRLVNVPQYYQDLRAPVSCLEYHTDSRGQFSSFGYDGKSLLLTNLDYSVCFKNPPDTCGATFRAKTFSMPSALTVPCTDGSAEVVAAGQCCQPLLAGPPARLVSGFVSINSLSVAPTPAVQNPLANFRTFFCGTTLGGPTNTIVQRGKGPIIARVKTSNVCPSTDPANLIPLEVACPLNGCVGFRIDYSVDTGTC